LIRAHIGKPACKQSSAEAAEQRRQRECRDLGGIAVDATTFAASSLSRTACMARPSFVFFQTPDEPPNRKQCRDAEAEIGAAVGKGVRPPDIPARHRARG